MDVFNVLPVFLYVVGFCLLWVGIFLGLRKFKLGLQDFVVRTWTGIKKIIAEITEETVPTTIEKEGDHSFLETPAKLGQQFKKQDEDFLLRIGALEEKQEKMTTIESQVETLLKNVAKFREEHKDTTEELKGYVKDLFKDYVVKEAEKQPKSCAKEQSKKREKEVLENSIEETQYKNNIINKYYLRTWGEDDLILIKKNDPCIYRRNSKRSPKQDLEYSRIIGEHILELAEKRETKQHFSRLKAFIDIAEENAWVITKFFEGGQFRYIIFERRKLKVKMYYNDGMYARAELTKGKEIVKMPRVQLKHLKNIFGLSKIWDGAIKEIRQIFRDRIACRRPF